MDTNPFAKLENPEVLKKEDIKPIVIPKAINLTPKAEAKKEIVAPAPAPILESEASRILAQFGGLPSNIPITHKYWKLRHARKRK